MKNIRLKCGVAVIGGGPGGLTAALAAARIGADVILAERNGYLGGNAVMGLPLLGYLSQHGRTIVGGIAQEFVDTLQAGGFSFGHSRCPFHNSVTLVHPEMFKIMALEKCAEAGVKLILHSEVIDAVTDCGKIVRASVMGKGQRVDIDADVFIDGTGDGDLGYICGARYEKGSDEAGKLGIMQPPTVMFSLSGFDEERFLTFIDENPENLKQNDTIEVSEGYDTKLFRSTPNHVFFGMQAYLDELRKKIDCPVLRENIIYINSTVPGKIFVNTVRIPGCDGSDIFSLTDGEIKGHLQVPKIVDMFKKYVPGFEDCTLDSISGTLGVRETRRFAGIKRLTADSVVAGEVPPDTIALGGYKIDIHNGGGSGTVLRMVREPYGIPLGCLISADFDGLLLSGRCISMDHQTLGSQRVMPTCMAVGEAAGVLAALAVKDGVSTRNVAAGKVREVLLAGGAILE